MLENLGEDLYHDQIHRLENEDMPAVAAGQHEADLSAVATGDADDRAEESDSATSDADSNVEREDFSTAAVASDDLPAVAAMEAAAPCADRASGLGHVGEQAELVQDTIHTLQAHLEGLRAVGCVRIVQCLEYDLGLAKRKLRNLTRQRRSPQ